VPEAMTYFTRYSDNFCWCVRTLREPTGPGRYRQRTPAMAAGLADQVWSLEEWLLFPSNNRYKPPCLSSKCSGNTTGTPPNIPAKSEQKAVGIRMVRGELDRPLSVEFRDCSCPRTTVLGTFSSSRLCYNRVCLDTLAIYYTAWGADPECSARSVRRCANDRATTPARRSTRNVPTPMPETRVTAHVM
jgi:hypothetical protein